MSASASSFCRSAVAALDNMTCSRASPRDLASCGPLGLGVDCVGGLAEVIAEVDDGLAAEVVAWEWESTL